MSQSELNRIWGEYHDSPYYQVLSYIDMWEKPIPRSHLNAFQEISLQRLASISPFDKDHPDQGFQIVLERIYAIKQADSF